MGRGYFVTGTDTGVGKTYVTCSLLRAFAGQGLMVAGYKPVAAGADLKEGLLRNDDAEALMALSTLTVSYEQVNPVCLSTPVSPRIAAALQGYVVDVHELVRGGEGLRQKADLVFAEGAGGWRVPLTDTLLMSDFAQKLSWPVLLVVGLRLGCINHARLTMEAMLADGVQVAGWIASHVDPHLLCADHVLDSLCKLLPAPLLAHSDFQGDDLRWTELGLCWYENNCK